VNEPVIEPVGETVPASVTLRRIRWWDLGAIVTLERALFPSDPWTHEQFWSELAGVPATRHYVLAEADGDTIGYAGLTATRHEADIQTVAVRTDRQGAGIGALLVTELLAETRRRGVGEVVLEVRADNEPARRLYARFGFTQVGVRRGYYRRLDGRPVDALLMRWRPHG
jgi:[ribosomal protein S18]-alanine N-acetyltransferase